MRFLMGVAVCLPLILCACSAAPLTLRTDLTAVTRSHRLAGTRVAIASVKDIRAERSLGEHRDGLARVHQFDYVSTRDIRKVVALNLEYVLMAAGARVVRADEAADLRLAVEIAALEVTTDGFLAGEETFGAVELRVEYVDGIGRPLGRRVVRKRPADEEFADAGLLGDGIRDALVDLVASLPPMAPQPPPLPPSELALTRAP